MDKGKQTAADHRGLKQRRREEQAESSHPVRQSTRAPWRPSDDLYGDTPGDLDLDHGRYEAPTPK